jgi:hypothetical protein
VGVEVEVGVLVVIMLKQEEVVQVAEEVHMLGKCIVLRI